MLKINPKEENLENLVCVWVKNCDHECNSECRVYDPRHTPSNKSASNTNIRMYDTRRTKAKLTTLTWNHKIKIKSRI